MVLALITGQAAAADAGQGIEIVATASDTRTLPHGDLVLGPDGNFYGTSVWGGINNAGYIYRVSPSGELTTLHEFSDYEEPSGVNVGGALPQAGVVFGADGALYGTTVFGGTGGLGTVYRLGLGLVSVLTTLHEFGTVDSDNKNVGGALPFAALLLGPDGNFYGTSTNGGAGGNGTIFRMTRTGVFTVLHDFGSSTARGEPNADGKYSSYRLLLGPDGALYGVSALGGPANGGTLFRITLSGDFSVLHVFGEQFKDDGQLPHFLMLGQDGALYGATTRGPGNLGYGLMFRHSAADGYRVLYVFNDLREGGGIYRNGFVQAADGTFYGTAYDYVFRFIPGVLYETLGVLLPGTLSTPSTTLIKGNDGKYYGTGDSWPGVFRFSPSLPPSIAVTVSSSRIRLGEPVTVTWSASAYEYCRAHRGNEEYGPWSEIITNEGSRTVTPSTMGPHEYQIACHNNNTDKPSGSKTVMVEVLAADAASGGSAATTGVAATSAGGGAWQPLALLWLMQLALIRLWIRKRASV
jgi:uncharacterized repeat protein (TIGR03803 family)